MGKEPDGWNYFRKWWVLTQERSLNTNAEHGELDRQPLQNWILTFLVVECAPKLSDPASNLEILISAVDLGVWPTINRLRLGRRHSNLWS